MWASQDFPYTKYLSGWRKSMRYLVFLTDRYDTILNCILGFPFGHTMQLTVSSNKFLCLVLSVGSRLLNLHNPS